MTFGLISKWVNIDELELIIKLQKYDQGQMCSNCLRGVSKDTAKTDFLKLSTISAITKQLWKLWFNVNRLDILLNSFFKV